MKKKILIPLFLTTLLLTSCNSTSGSIRDLEYRINYLEEDNKYLEKKLYYLEKLDNPELDEYTKRLYDIENPLEIENEIRIHLNGFELLSEDGLNEGEAILDLNYSYTHELENINVSVRPSELSYDNKTFEFTNFADYNTRENNGVFHGNDKIYIKYPKDKIYLKFNVGAFGIYILQYLLLNLMRWTYEEKILYNSDFNLYSIANSF